MIEALKTLFYRFCDDEYFFVFLDPMFVWGIGLGLMFYIGSFFFKETKTRALALVVMMVSAFAIYPYMKNRESAAPGVRGTWTQRASTFNEQHERRENTQWFYYAFALLALVTLVLGKKFGAILPIFTIIAALVMFVLSLWLHMKESEVYHPNIVKPLPK